MKQKVKRDTYLVVYTVYKVRPARLKLFGTCVWDPIFSCSWRWLAMLVFKLTHNATWDKDSTVFPRAEHVEDCQYKTTKDGKLVRTNE